ncbi:MAG: hypothetical protein JWO13_1289 [Acidobacteriales bacterium]|nr:hypothetical protein [Terriglobales bacterium]
MCSQCIKTARPKARCLFTLTSIKVWTSNPSEFEVFMQYGAPAGSNPFGVLTAIVAPAILTNACSILSLGTSNRLARVVDRTRIVADELARCDPNSAAHEAWTRQLEGLQIRAQLLLKALRAMYASVGLFAAAALISVGGSLATYYGQQIVFQLAAGLALVTGASAVFGLSYGCIMMVRETRFAVQILAEEAEVRSAHGFGTQPNR